MFSYSSSDGSAHGTTAPHLLERSTARIWNTHFLPSTGGFGLAKHFLTRSRTLQLGDTLLCFFQVFARHELLNQAHVVGERLGRLL